MSDLAFSEKLVNPGIQYLLLFLVVISEELDKLFLKGLNLRYIVFSQMFMDPFQELLYVAVFGSHHFSGASPIHARFVFKAWKQDVFLPCYVPLQSRFELAEKGFCPGLLLPPQSSLNSRNSPSSRS
ncbi:MAG: hypothetical protein V3U24_03850 [Candidatus Neomarinimicrobiota bacterium]